MFQFKIAEMTFSSYVNNRAHKTDIVEINITNTPTIGRLVSFVSN